MSVDLAVVPVAGRGTRMLPLTKSQPKEMLPMGRKPVVQYVVEELARCGIGRLLFVMVVSAIWRRACGAVMLVCAVIYFLAAMCNHFRWLGPASV